MRNFFPVVAGALSFALMAFTSTPAFAQQGIDYAKVRADYESRLADPRIEQRERELERREELLEKREQALERASYRDRDRTGEIIAGVAAATVLGVVAEEIFWDRPRFNRGFRFRGNRFNRRFDCFRCYSGWRDFRRIPRRVCRWERVRFRGPLVRRCYRGF